MRYVADYIIRVIQDRQRGDPLVMHELECICNRLVAAFYHSQHDAR